MDKSQLSNPANTRNVSQSKSKPKICMNGPIGNGGHGMNGPTNKPLNLNECIIEEEECNNQIMGNGTNTNTNTNSDSETKDDEKYDSERSSSVKSPAARAASMFGEPAEIPVPVPVISPIMQELPYGIQILRTMLSETVDISYKQLGRGLKDCVWPASCKNKLGSNRLAVHSIHSGLHTLFTTLNLPFKSEVLITGITSPAILRVIELHGLIAKAIDINLSTMEPTTNIKHLITPKTRIILLSHLFGTMFKIPQIETLSKLRNQQDILIIEDCSQIYPTNSVINSDICMYDFNLNNPATALNGAVFEFRGPSSTSTALKQRFSHLMKTYRKQSTISYLFTLLFWIFLLPIVQLITSKYIQHLLLKMCHFFSINYLTFMNKMSKQKFTKTLELQACKPVVLMIHRRMQLKMKLKSKSIIQKNLSKRKILGNYGLKAMGDLFDANDEGDGLIPGNKCETHSFWSFPVCINNRDRVITKMRKLGYHITRSNTSSKMIALPNAVNSDYFLDHVVYLPLNMSLKAFKNMIREFKKLVRRNKKKYKQVCKVTMLNYFTWAIEILIVLFLLRYVWIYVLILCGVSYYLWKPTRNFRELPYQGVKAQRKRSENVVNAIVTGATGFLGEVLVHDLLDTYPTDQLNLYLIIRSKKNCKPIERCKKLFDDNGIPANVSVIEGDIDTIKFCDIINNIGFEANITHVIHSAADVRFNSSHSDIAKSNIAHTLKMKKISDKFKAKFVYISTAFVHSESGKSTNYLHAGKVQLASEMTANQLYYLMLKDRHEIDDYMKKYSIENNYVLSKMITESLIGKDSVTIRPSIIAPSWNFPKPCWGGRGASTITLMIAVVAGRLLRCFGRGHPLHGQLPMPIVPVDWVSKTIIDSLDDPLDTIRLAALNSKKSKVPSFHQFSFIATSYMYSMETLTGVEVVVIRLVTILSSFSPFMFRLCKYITNEIPCPRKYVRILQLVNQYEHFSSTSFNVKQGLTPPQDFDATKYCSMLIEIASELAKLPIDNLKSAIPYKSHQNVVVSISNTFFSWVLNKTTNSVIVDTEKLKQLSGKKNIVLVPTHRSFFDFLIVGKICLKYTMYGLSLPSSFASSKFKQAPLIAICLKYMHAIFITPGSHSTQGGLQKQIQDISAKKNVFQLFIEGTRSRTRKFLRPHTGVLSCLAEAMDLTVVPIAINYERIPDQYSFYQELDGEKIGFSVIRLFVWFYKVFRNEIQLGDINVQIGDIIYVQKQDYNKEYFQSVVNEIQLQHMRMVNITDYHISHFQNPKHLKNVLTKMGCQVKSTTLKAENSENDGENDNDKEDYMKTMQWAHFLADTMKAETKQWLTNGNICVTDNEYDINGFTLEDKLAINQVKTRLDYIIDSYVHDDNLMQFKSKKQVDKIIVHDQNLGYWGYCDSGFRLLEGDKVFFRGSRYAISNKNFAGNSVVFLSKLSGIPLLKKKKYNPVSLTVPATHPQINKVVDYLYALFGSHDENICTDVYVRYHHATGHTISDMTTLRCKSINKDFRIPDIILYPKSGQKQELIQLVQNCVRLNCMLIPYGGGTNVTHALWCDPNETRVIVSVDMTQMNKLIWVNRENNTANIMAGITGKDLEIELQKCGYTTGHYPDSYEFSTLGGWVATYASGMKRCKYGNIEEIVIGIEFITANGLVSRNMPYGRIAAGTCVLAPLFGSEGTLGLITSAVVRLHKIPDVIAYDSVVFPDWNSGLNMMKMQKNQPQYKRPASLRLVDNTQMLLSHTLKVKTSPFSVSGIVGKLAKFYLALWKKFDFKKVCAATIVYEGTAEQVAIQKAAMNKIIAQNGGIRGGETNGRAGFNLTFAIAYLRDFLLENFGIMAESFETFIPWDKIDGFQQSLHDDIANEHKARGLKGSPFLSSRISQVYNEGVCLYLYYGCHTERLSKSALEIFHSMAVFIRTSMLKKGGSISHHHGIGQIRAKFSKKLSSQSMINLTNEVKNAFDPDNIFGVANGVLAKADDDDHKHDEDDMSTEV